MAISSPGLGSGLDVNGIVSQIMTVERQPITALDKKQAGFQSKLSAYGSIKSALAAFQATMIGLATPSRFTTTTATSSDAATVGVSASGNPAAGSYSVEVTALAQAQKLVASGQASTTAAIGAGASTTLTFDFGTVSGGSFAAGTYTGASYTSGGAGTKTVTIDATNNSLAGIRDAINAANIGVTAGIVNDGGTSPYRLVLTSTATGADKAMKIAVNGDATLAGLLAHDPAGTQNLTETVTAKNAAFKIDGLAISKTSNTVTDAIPGLTLTLTRQTAADAPVRLTVTQDRSQATAAVSSFVSAYNQLNTTLTKLTAYNATDKQASVLTGDATARSIQTQLRSVLTTALTGVPGSYRTLSQVGVSFQADGTLAVDSGKLQAAVTADPQSVMALFAAVGSATDSQASYVSATAKSQPGSYPVTVTSFATQGALVGSAAAALTITADVNDTLGIEVDGAAATVKLAAGTYTAAQLATQLQAAINGAAAVSAAGSKVTVTESSGTLTVTSGRSGSASTVKITGGTAAVPLFGATPTRAAGTDLAGTLGGVTATGSGQTLTGAAGTAAEGLKIAIASGATGARGSLYFSRGMADRLQNLVADVLDADGALTSRTDGLTATMKDLAGRRAALELRMTAIEKRYRAQFTSLDTMMSNMSKTSSYLQQQLANLPKPGNA